MNEKIMHMIQNVPQDQLPNDKESYDLASDPLEGIINFKKMGRLPSIPSRKIKHSIAGVGMETLDRDTFDPAPVIPLLGEAGVKHVRLQTGWVKCERKPGLYDFAWLDDLVNALIENGIEPWFSISFGNPLYTPNKQYDDVRKQDYNSFSDMPAWPRGYIAESPFYHGEKAMNAFLRYAAKLAEHFVDRVKLYEIWNEPDVAGFWRKNGQVMRDVYGVDQTARDYAEFVRRTAKVIRATDPNAKIASVTSYAGTSSFLRTLGNEGIGRHVDVHCFHSYDEYAQIPEAYIEQRIAHMHQCLDMPGHTLELYQGESGRATAGSAIGLARPSEYNQAKFIARRYYTDAAAGVGLSSYFTASDLKNYYPDGQDQTYGIIDRSARCKLGYYTLQGCAGLMSNLVKDDGIIAFFKLNY
jgi:polysaccharide biosynthesis protein PslG